MAIEQPVWDTRRKIGILIDWRGGIWPPGQAGKGTGRDDIHTALDWKTSSGIYENQWLHIHEGAWMYNNKMEHDETGEIEQVGIVRTGTRHKRKYEY